MTDDQRAAPPWGKWFVLREEHDFKVKQIEVLPGARLSYQKHCRREEYWHFVRGEGKVTIDGREIVVSQGDMISVGRECLHRIENLGTHTLVLIEIQRGEYFGEDDIVRVEDDYGRA